MEREQVLRQAIIKWGVNAQLDMAVEEAAELQKAICKLKRSNKNPEPVMVANLLEEIADVEIMCQQLRIMFDENNQVDTLKDFKISRLQGRLNQLKP